MTRTTKNQRNGISLMELTTMFPTEESAIKWFENIKWGDSGEHCPKCGSVRISIVKSKKPMPYRCKDCRQHFSVKTGTIMADSNLPVRKWVFAIYLITTSLKGVSSMKLHRDLDIAQNHSWTLAQKIREAFVNNIQLEGIVEADETFIGGKVKNMSRAKRARTHGAGTANKQAVLGMVERGGRIVAKPVINIGARTLQREVLANVKQGSVLYTDELSSYKKLGKVYKHQSVNHSAWEYVRGQAHTNGIESFWALLKRGYHGTYHKMSVKHLHRYVNEFAARHNNRSIETLEQMSLIAKGFIGKSLTYKELIK